VVQFDKRRTRGRTEEGRYVRLHAHGGAGGIGPGAEGFLGEISTNDLRRLEVGGAQYGYVLDASGEALDDIIVYRRGADKFMVVVNASNEGR